VPGIRNPVAIRVADSDIYEFNQSLGPGQEPFALPFEVKTIVDAGANVGYTVLRFFTQFPLAKIIAIEPDAINLAQLMKNCAGYPNLMVERAALWSHQCNLTIRDPEVASNAFIVEEDAAGDIPALSIPDVLDRHDLATIDLLKIDIEGSETEVLGDPKSQDWLPRIRALLVETHNDFRPGSAEAVRRAVAGHMTYQGHVNEYEFYLAG
jgi:FkbM family methyltransferase